MSSIQGYFESRAREGDGQFAIAFALMALTTSIKYLGTGDAASTMGAIEFLATAVETAGRNISDALQSDVHRTDHPLMGETLDGISSALKQIADNIDRAAGPGEQQQAEAENAAWQRFLQNEETKNSDRNK